MRPVSPYLALAVTTFLAYIIGGLPFGYIFVHLSCGKDVRTMGSGNIGATNVHRTMGRKAGLIVLFLDIVKGYSAVWIAGVATHNDRLALAFAAAAVMAGHCYSVFLRFKGGKAVACFIGAFLYLAPLALAVSLLVFAVVVAFSKYISLGSIIAVGVFPVAVWCVQRPAQPILLASIFGAVLIIYRHKMNILRLVNGQENVFSLKGGSLKGDST
ncbi:MAG: glycerol-3-phosphate 1-O-acyltransferase PlsY [Bryobacteraceae bacterium]